MIKERALRPKKRMMIDECILMVNHFVHYHNYNLLVGHNWWDRTPSFVAIHTPSINLFIR